MVEMTTRRRMDLDFKAWAVRTGHDSYMLPESFAKGEPYDSVVASSMFAAFTAGCECGILMVQPLLDKVEAAARNANTVASKLDRGGE